MTIKKLESYCLIFMLTVLVINYAFFAPWANRLVPVALMTLAFVYVISGMAANETGKNVDDSASGKKAFGFENLAYMVFAVFMIGALFTIQYWAMASYYLTVALVALAIVVAVIGFQYANGKLYNAVLVKRAVAYFFLAMILTVMPRFTLLDIKYRSQPAYLNAVKSSLQHPGDTALSNKANRERIKMNAPK